jgi:hypothetical protein
MPISPISETAISFQLGEHPSDRDVGWDDTCGFWLDYAVCTPVYTASGEMS